MNNVDNISSAWGAIRPILKEEFDFSQIKDIVGLAGIDVTQMSHLVQKSGSGGASKGQLIAEIDKHFSKKSRAAGKCYQR